MEIWVPLIGIFLSLLCLFFAIRSGRRKRLIDNIPTSKTTGIFMGLVELKGTAETEWPLAAYLTSRSCVYYQWSVQEHWQRTVTETYKDSQGKTQTRTRTESGWTTVANGGEMMPFYLRDDLGAVRVVPENAKVEPLKTLDHTCGPTDPLYYGRGPAGAIANSTFRRRFIENAIPLHAPIFVMGTARERQDIVAPEIAYDKKEEIFLISTRSEEQVSRGHRITFVLLSILGFIFAIGGLWVRDAMIELPSQKLSIWIYLLTAFGYCVAWFISWFIMVYNSMINLKHRVTQAWSNVDVQLKRRADLIPNLVSAVQGIRDHESDTQTLVAELRNQLAATAPWKQGPDPAAVTPKLVALAESYPELKANENFLHLQESLVDTEHRIALSRAYYNDIATFYNTRLELVPDRFISQLARLTPRTLMAANQFERESVQVKFAE
jgi:hypothetical protein